MYNINLLHGNLIGKKQLEFYVQFIYREKLSQRKLALVVHTFEIFVRNVIRAQSEVKINKKVVW